MSRKSVMALLVSITLLYFLINGIIRATELSALCVISQYSCTDVINILCDCLV
jgi:hypothetical protein